MTPGQWRGHKQSCVGLNVAGPPSAPLPPLDHDGAHDAGWDGDEDNDAAPAPAAAAAAAGVPVLPVAPEVVAPHVEPR